MDKYKEMFREEAKELLDEIQTTLLSLETEPEDAELIGRVFRAMHNLKGSGGMFGFDGISSFTHDIETVYDLVRDGKVKVNNNLIDLTLQACDHISLRLIRENDGDEAMKEKGDRILKEFTNYLPKKETKKSIVSSLLSRTDEKSSQEKSEVKNKTYWIKFVPQPDIFSTGTNPVLLLDELRALGQCLIIAETNKIPQLDKLDAELCLIYWDIILTTSQEKNAIRDVFIFVEDNCDLKIDIIDQNGYINSNSYQHFQDVLNQKGKLTKADINRIINDKKSEEPLPPEKEEIPSEKQDMPSDQQKAALPENQTEKEKVPKKEQDKAVSNIRVSSDKLDKLINLVGELVTVQASLSQRAVNNNDSELLPIAEDVERLTRELRDISMEIRLIPIGTLFNRFKRLVRDISQQQGKEIELILEGEGTELDKTIIERLNDPMVHLVRNSIDHGIEEPDIREKAGKNKKGQIQISATQCGADVLIEIKDDGRGIDPEVIRNKAIEKGLIQSDSLLTKQETLQLIFAPGFSTAEKISNISGRGVGMDVVKRNIEGLRGSVTIQSQKGSGTTMALNLPLTLGIIEGLLVRIAKNNYVFPLSLVEDCMEFNNNNKDKNNGSRFLDVRGEIVPYLRLREQYEIRAQIPHIEHIVITSVNGQKTGFVVDEIIGEHQIVIKTLGKMYKNIEGLSGATILGDGSVALILDVPKLVQIAEAEEAELRV